MSLQDDINAQLDIPRSEKKIDGGPAFPETHVHPDIEFHPTTGLTPGWHGKSGMTLRDYFAAQILAGAINLRPDFHQDQIAKLAYEIADAMLKEREK